MNTSEKVLTFAAIFISCLALAVSIIQTRIMQKQSHSSVWPRLDQGTGAGPDYYNYSLRNVGVGPAIVKDFKYIYKDTSFQTINTMMEDLKKRQLKKN